MCLKHLETCKPLVGSQSHRCPFPIGWLMNRGVWNPVNNKNQQVNDDRWYTKPVFLFLPKGRYCPELVFPAGCMEVLRRNCTKKQRQDIKKRFRRRQANRTNKKAWHPTKCNACRIALQKESLGNMYEYLWICMNMHGLLILENLSRNKTPVQSPAFFCIVAFGEPGLPSEDCFQERKEGLAGWKRLGVIGPVDLVVLSGSAARMGKSWCGRCEWTSNYFWWTSWILGWSFPR